jgi:hypothetical protein
MKDLKIGQTTLVQSAIDPRRQQEIQEFLNAIVKLLKASYPNETNPDKFKGTVDTIMKSLWHSDPGSIVLKHIPETDFLTRQSNSMWWAQTPKRIHDVMFLKAWKQ